MSKCHFPLVLMIALAITPILSVYVPRFLAFWPLILGLGTSYWFIIIRKELFHVSRLYYICAGIISILCLLSVIWSISPMQSLEDALRVTAILLVGGLLVSSFKALEIEDFKPYGWLLPAGILVAASLCIFDLYTDLSIYKLIHEYDKTTNSSELNRGIICLIFAYFLSLPLIQYLDWREKPEVPSHSSDRYCDSYYAAPEPKPDRAACFWCRSDPVFRYPARWRLGYILLGLGVFAALLTTPIIVSFLYDRLVIDYQDSVFWLREAYIGNRVEIWRFVMKYAVNNPLYGFGIEATNFVPHFDFAHIYNEKDTVLHPHNFSVQIWMEFGCLEQ